MVRTHAVQDGQVVRMEHTRLRTELLQQTLGLQRQFSAEGLRAQRAVQNEDARRMLRTGDGELVGVRDVEGLGRELRQQCNCHVGLLGCDCSIILELWK